MVVNPASDISEKKTSSLECRIFIATAITAFGELCASLLTVRTKAGLESQCQPSRYIVKKGII